MTSAEEPYLVVHGTDWENVQTGPLRIWRYSEKDLDANPTGRIWMLRGMKVTYATQWDSLSRGYIRAQPESMIPEACVHTAIEDVTEVNAIMNFFS